MTDESATDGKRTAALAISSYTHNGRFVVEASGEVSISNADLLGQAFAQIPTIAFPITVDFRQVRFIDSTAITHLILMSRRVREHDRAALPRVVVTQGTQPHRVLRLTGLGKILEIAHDLDGETEHLPDGNVVA